MSILQDFKIAAQENNHQEIEKIINNPSFEFSNSFYGIVCLCISLGYLKIIEVICNNEKFDPSVLKNKFISHSFEYNQFHILDLFWKDKRVKKTLKVDNLELYNILIKIDMEEKIEVF